MGIITLNSIVGVGVQSIVSGCLVGRDAVTGKARLLEYAFANGYALDYLAFAGKGSMEIGGL